MLEFSNVDFSYGDKVIFKNFSFKADENTHTAILGMSGFGKTTFLNLAFGIATPQRGKITRFSSKKQSFVFQEDRLLPWKNVLENLLSVNIKKEKAMEILEKLGLSDVTEKYPQELSGGMQRRIAIGRALAFGGDVFFFDEPLHGLDIKTSGEVLGLIKNEIKDKTALIVTHSPTEAFALSERIVLVGNSPLEILEDVKKSDFRDENELFEFVKKRI